MYIVTSKWFQHTFTAALAQHIVFHGMTVSYQMWINVGTASANWPDIKPTLGERSVFAQLDSRNPLLLTQITNISKQHMFIGKHLICICNKENGTKKQQHCHSEICLNIIHR